jgi:hypothetical protein
VDVYTIAARNYAAHVRVLAGSLAQQHPDWRLHALMVDGFRGYLDPAAEPFELLEVEQLEVPQFERMAASYGVLELCTAVKPWLLRHALERAEAALYLDPDIKVYGPLGLVEEAAGEAEVVLTPHTASPLPRDGRIPGDLELLRAGSYNLGFLAMSRGAVSAQLLEWWAGWLAEHCLDDHAAGLYVDQRWMDLAAAMWPVRVLRDPGLNVAYWNLPVRRLERNPGGFTVDGGPLRFFHFSVFDPRRPDVVSDHQDRLRTEDDPVLAAVYRDYAEDLLAHGWEQVHAWPYGHGTTASGIPLTQPLRRLFWRGSRQGALSAPPFTPAGERAFLAWLNEPAELGARAGVTRYLLELWRMRPDVQRAHPALDGPDGPDFLNWARWYGRDDYRIPDALLPPEPHTGPPRRRPAARRALARLRRAP